MVVAPIDERDLDVRNVPEETARGQTAEATSHDDDSVRHLRITPWRRSVDAEYVRAILSEWGGERQEARDPLSG
jgi:hypothetical protein